MKYYQEITIISQPDTNDHHILSVLYNKLHGNVFGASKSPRNIGVSFPEYVRAANIKNSKMGGMVRLFAETKAQLEALNLADMLSDIEDYVQVESIDEVGAKATHYEVYTRYKHKSLQRKTKSFIKLTNAKRDESDKITEAEALKHCIKYKSPSLFYPFIHLTSTSNGKPYCLNIKREVVDSPTEANSFDSFGLSSKSPNCTSAVPAW